MRRLGMLLVLASLGCGGSGLPETAPVSGSVTLDGQPIATGKIIFLPKVGKMARGEIENGQIVGVRTFEPDDGVIVGTARVAIQPAVIKDPRGGPTSEMGRRARPGEPGYVPSRYVSAQRSGLTAEIASGKNELEFALTSR